MEHNMNVNTQGVTVTTTTTSQTTGGSITRRIASKLNVAYFKTIPGILKIAQFVLSILAVICFAVTSYPGWRPGEFFDFVVSSAITITFILMILYLVGVVRLIYRVPWNLVEGVYCLLWTLLYLIASSLFASYGYLSAGIGAAAFFGFCCMIAYGADGVMKILAHRSGRRADGVVVQETMTTVTSHHDTLDNNAVPA